MRQNAQQPGFFLRFLFALAMAVTFTGCVAPKTVTKVGAPLGGYHKVYFVEGADDPRAVFPRVVWRLQEMGFKVTVVNPKNRPIDLQGSGFIISPDGEVLTCAHVVGSLTNATIWVNGVRYLCQVSYADTNLDLALLKVQGEHPPFHPLPVESGYNYSLGQNVYTMGFPLADVLGVSPRLDNGLINAKVGMNDDTNFVQISVPVQPGNSGGPLLNANGQVIGVVGSTLSPLGVLVRTGGALPQNVNFAIKTSSIDRFLAESQVTAPTNRVAAGSFDQAENSIALVRSGDVTDEDLKTKSLVCICQYQSIFDFTWRFRVIGIGFIDAKNGNQVLTVAQGLGNYSEDKQLDNLFSKIFAKFHPNQPNPFF